MKSDYISLHKNKILSQRVLTLSPFLCSLDFRGDFWTVHLPHTERQVLLTLHILKYGKTEFVIWLCTGVVTCEVVLQWVKTVSLMNCFISWLSEWIISSGLINSWVAVSFIDLALTRSSMPGKNTTCNKTVWGLQGMGLLLDGQPLWAGVFVSHPGGVCLQSSVWDGISTATNHVNQWWKWPSVSDLYIFVRSQLTSFTIIEGDSPGIILSGPIKYDQTSQDQHATPSQLLFSGVPVLSHHLNPSNIWGENVILTQTED